MKLSTEEKITILEYAIELLEIGECMYICNALRRSVYHHYRKWFFKNIDIHELFPFLIAYKPINAPIYGEWWPRAMTTHRINVLKEIILILKQNPK